MTAPRGYGLNIYITEKTRHQIEQLERVLKLSRAGVIRQAVEELYGKAAGEKKEGDHE